MNERQSSSDASKLKIDWRQVMADAITLKPSARDSKVLERSGFGSNPGALRMYSYVPEGIGDGAALVVVLHGCGQDAAAYAHDAGWVALAERFGFALLAPQQTLGNNIGGCFNWFSADDTRRGRGEAASIFEMIQSMISEHALDRARVFVTGLSAGGAMTSAMLAAYPEVFAGGSIVAGLPHGAARNLNEAITSMRQAPSLSGSQWGEHVRRSSAHVGPWPRVAIWHGDADATVNPGNAEALILQWTNVHGLGDAHADESVEPSHRKRTWRDDKGAAIIEVFTLPGFAHGTPIRAEDGYGNAGAFVFEGGVSASYHTARFWGLTDEAAKAADRIVQPTKTGDPEVLAPDVLAQPVPAARLKTRSQGRMQKIIEDALRAIGLARR